MFREGKGKLGWEGKGEEETFRSNIVYVHYLDFGNSFISVYISQNL